MIHIEDEKLRVKGTSKELIGEVFLIIMSVINDNVLKAVDDLSKTDIKLILTYLIAMEVGLDEAEKLGIAKSVGKTDLSKASRIIEEILRDKTFLNSEEAE